VTVCAGLLTDKHNKNAEMVASEREDIVFVLRIALPRSSGSAALERSSVLLVSNFESLFPSIGNAREAGRVPPYCSLRSLFYRCDVFFG